MTDFTYKKEKDDGPMAERESELPRMRVKLGEDQVKGLKLGEEIEIVLVGKVTSLHGEDRWDGAGAEIELKKSKTKTRGEDQDELDEMFGS